MEILALKEKTLRDDPDLVDYIYFLYRASLDRLNSLADTANP
jgi:hypothetical protein